MTDTIGTDGEQTDDDVTLWWLRMGIVVFGALAVLFAGAYRYGFAETIRPLGLLGFTLLFAMTAGAYYLRATSSSDRSASFTPADPRDRFIKEAAHAVDDGHDVEDVVEALRGAADAIVADNPDGERDGPTTMAEEAAREERGA